MGNCRIDTAEKLATSVAGERQELFDTRREGVESRYLRSDLWLVYSPAKALFPCNTSRFPQSLPCRGCWCPNSPMPPRSMFGWNRKPRFRFAIRFTKGTKVKQTCGLPCGVVGWLRDFQFSSRTSLQSKAMPATNEARSKSALKGRTYGRFFFVAVSGLLKILL